MGSPPKDLDVQCPAAGTGLEVGGRPAMRCLRTRCSAALQEDSGEGRSAVGDWGPEPWESDEAAARFHTLWRRCDLSLRVDEIMSFDERSERYDSCRAARSAQRHARGAAEQKHQCPGEHDQSAQRSLGVHATWAMLRTLWAVCGGRSPSCVDGAPRSCDRVRGGRARRPAAGSAVQL
jgi:hypothetical protein